MINIKRGDISRDVTTIQSMLRNVGWNVEPDGKFGLFTEAAVRCYQTDNDLTSDGVVGPITYSHLEDIKIGDTWEKYQALRDPIIRVWPVRYFSQRDNVYKPNGTCNVTSIAMVLDYLRIEPRDGTQLEDELFEHLNTNEAKQKMWEMYPWTKNKASINPRNVHGMLKWLVEKYYNCIDDYSYSYTMTKILNYLEYAGPVILSGSFTASGHIICAIGLTARDDLIVHDPWGSWNFGYKNSNGQHVIYQLDSVTRVLSGSSQTEKLAHFITKRT